MFNMKRCPFRRWEPLKRIARIKCVRVRESYGNATHLLGGWNRFNEMRLFHTSPLIRPLRDLTSKNKQSNLLNFGNMVNLEFP